MFSFRKRNAQAQRTLPGKRAQFHWRKSYNWMLLVLPLLVGFSYLSQGPQLPTLLPIKTVQLSGSFQYIDQKEVESVLQNFVGKGFFSLDIQQVQKVLKERAWTESVSIRRVWPDRIKIQIVEKKPLARWDNKHLISDHAQVFAANTADFAALPLVHAVNSKPVHILNQYYRLAQRFAELDEQLVAAQLDSRGALEIRLANGLVIKVGREDTEAKIERLTRIYQQQIQPRLAEIQLLDLRYSNGFAVAWKKDALRDRSEASLWRNKNV